MAFTLGNFSVDEILYGVAEHDYDDGNGIQIVYTLDQLSSASIEISSESTDITDKRGNIVRTIYKNKTGTFSATNAFLNPHIINAASGAKIEYAASGATIAMPKIDVVAANSTKVVSYAIDTAAVDSSVEVIGLEGNGANVALTVTTGTTPAAGQYAYSTTDNKVYLGPAGDTGIVKYVIKYDRDAESGMKLTNSSNEFPETVKLTLFCSIVDPCDDDLKAAYVVLPSFQPSPETTVSLNSDEQEMDFSGNLQLDYCSADQALYYIYFPDDGKVSTGAVDGTVAA